MKIVARSLAGAFLLAAASFGLGAADVIVLQGGARIELREAAVRQGNLVLLTRADGTRFSVRAGDVDWKATAAAKTATRTPARQSPAIVGSPETPAQAARANRNGPKARVKLTDADVSHASDESPAEEKKDGRANAGGGRLEIADYAQEKSGGNVVVRGSVRNTGAVAASNARMTVTALDEKGETIASGEAGLSNGVVDSGGTVSFSVTIPIGEKTVGSIRFAPQWMAPAAPGPAVSPTPAAPAAARPAARNPAPAPTPYGQGNLYAAPAPPASTTPSADGKTGYVPGMAHPDNQPKPPN